MSDEIQLKLTEDEAWVLFEFVRRFSDTDQLSIEDQAEQRALWNLCCVFEKTLHQAQDISYEKFIAQCRDRLRDEP
ncbi:hypothetical protein [Marinobacter profundi]|jgi:hypothetical protein|uniref:Uncharacterized protein n=1 Tax=Marinobacter profundi TaxID=2666256 RepID=A0A2G1UKV5_9GAMM|nr:hypothetical protein [Marinobacter profundi]PHQ15126.1 hypothetical protein CLH61_08250 [Marinobacter profundi]